MTRVAEPVHLPCSCRKTGSLAFVEAHSWPKPRPRTQPKLALEEHRSCKQSAHRKRRGRPAELTQDAQQTAKADATTYNLKNGAELREHGIQRLLQGGFLHFFIQVVDVKGLVGRHIAGDKAGRDSHCAEPGRVKSGECTQK